MTSTEIASASKIMIGSTEASAMYIGSDKLWPVDLHDYSLDYFTIESLEDDNTIRIVKKGRVLNNISLSYSTNNGTTWTDLTVSDSINLTTINTGDKVIFKGTNSSLSSGSTKYWTFFPSKNFNVCGNIMSLLFGDNFINNSKFASGTTHQLNGLFNGAKKLINAKNLILPATTLAPYCYNGMFGGCTSLTTAPTLPATTLVSYCYVGMFSGCTSLTTAPALPATTLGNFCYSGMFNMCTSLTTAPILPATTLWTNCYSNMFNDCTSLTTAPILPATTLTRNCYTGMFSGCTSLNYIKAMFTTTPSDSYTLGWVDSVAASGTFVKNSAATWDVTGDNGIPSGWTVLTSSS